MVSHSIYHDIILDHYRTPRCYGRLDKSTHTAEVSNPLCGDMLTVDLIIHGNTIIQAAFIGQGCAISQASASMLMERISGKSVQTIKKYSKEIILKQLGITLSPNRLKCALLALEGVHTAFDSKI